MEKTILFNNFDKVPLGPGIKVLKDYGIRTFIVEDRPIRRIRGWYVRILANSQKELDEWLKMYSDIYIDE